jgi:L-gulonolactone oxidase
MELVTVAGDELSLRDDREGDAELLPAARTHLGALGIVTEVELGVETGRWIRLEVGASSSAEIVDPAFPTTAEHVEAWWFPFTRKAVSLRRSLTSAPAGLHRTTPRFVRRIVGQDLPLAVALRLVRARPALAPALMGWLARVGAEGRAVVGRWDRLTMGPRWLRGPGMELALPADRVGEALDRLEGVVEAGRSGHPHHLPVHVRWARADRGSLLSPAAGRDTVFLDVSWWRGMPGWREGLAAVEDALEPLGLRPHWAKVAFRNPSACYPEFARWAAVRARLDPDGRLLNPFLRALLAGRPLLPRPPAAGERLGVGVAGG